MTNEMITKPSSATVTIGQETFTEEDSLATRARHNVMVKALNETDYSFTSVPGALSWLGSPSSESENCKVSTPCYQVLFILLHYFYG